MRGIAGNTTTTDSGCAGFTLIELLVTVVIAGVLTTLVILSFRGNSRAEQLTSDAETLAYLIQQNCREALLEQRLRALAIQSDGYTFMRRRGPEWEALAREPYHQRQWRQPWQVDLSFLTAGGISAASAEISGSKAQPRIICLADGELLPFRLRLQAADTDPISLESQPGGLVRLSASP